MRSLSAPRAPFSGGRRRSDRWVAYLLVALIAMSGFSTTYSIQRQHEADVRLEQAAKEREELLNEVRDQNRTVLCLGNNTTTAELAFATYLLTRPEDANNPEAQEALAQLREARDRLDEARIVGIVPCFPSPPTTR